MLGNQDINILITAKTIGEAQIKAMGTAVTGLDTLIKQLDASIQKNSATLGQNAGALSANTAALLANTTAVAALTASNATLSSSSNAVAGSLRNASGAAQHLTTDMMAASAASRFLEGTLPIRAMEKFLLNVLSLGPILQIAFPVIGALALAEAIYKGAEAASKAINNYYFMVDAQKELTKSSRGLATETEQMYARMQKAQVNYLRTTGRPVEAAQLERLQAGSAPIKIAGLDDKGISQLSKSQQRNLKDVYADLIPADLDDRIAKVNKLIKDTDDQLAKSRSRALSNLPSSDLRMGVGTGELRNSEQLTTTRSYLESNLQSLNQAKLTYNAEDKEAGAKVQKAQDDADKKGNKELSQALREFASLMKSRVQSATKNEYADGGALGNLIGSKQAELDQNSEVAGAAGQNPDALNAATIAAFAPRIAAATSKIIRQAFQAASNDAKTFDLSELKIESYDKDFKKELSDNIASGTKDLAIRKATRSQYNEDDVDSLKSEASKSARLNASKYSDDPAYGSAVAFQNQMQLANQILEIRKNQLAVEKELALLGNDQNAADEADKALAVARREFDKATDEAKSTRLQAYYDLQKKQLDDTKQQAGQIFDALTSGKKNGIADFITGQARVVGRQVFSNTAGVLFQGGQAAGLGNAIGGQRNQDGSLSTIGKLLEGTVFGSKQGAPLDVNTKSHNANTDAVNKLTATLVSGGSGGTLTGGNGTFSDGAGLGGLLSTPGFSSATSGLNGLGLGGIVGALSSTAGIGKSSSANYNGLGGIFSGLGHSGDLTGILSGVSNTKNGAESLNSTERISGGIGTAGVLIGGGISAVNSFSKGGARGILGGFGSLAGGAAALDPEPISKMVLSGVALATSVFTSLMGDPKAARAKAEEAYVHNNMSDLALTNPTQTQTYDVSGAGSDYNSSGRSRAFGSTTNITMTVHAMDSQSILDRSSDISDAVVKGLNSGHGIASQIQSLVA